MWEIICGIAITVLLFLYGYADGERRIETASHNELKKTHEELRKRTQETYEECLQLRIQQKKDLESAIKYSLSHCRTQQDKKELLEIITDNLWYVGEINNVTDFFKYDIKYVIKVCAYAKKGRLDWYQNYSESEDNLYRLDKDGQYVLLTKEELGKLKNKNYDFIFEEDVED